MENNSPEEYLLNIPLWTKKKNSISDVKQILKRLGNPEKGKKIIHIAGTNGKGSVCAYLTSVFLECGYKTGTFTSPHLVDLRERILMNGQMICQNTFEKCFHRVLKVVKEAMEDGFCHPTFFEFLFYMSMTAFEEAGTDIIILETGLGGRLDTTNAIENPIISVITSISLDHTEYLGNTISKIAAEKAGIIKEHVPVIFWDDQKEVSEVMIREAEKKGAKIYPVSERNYKIKNVEPLQIEISSAGDLKIDLDIPFKAFYQAENAMIAFKTCSVVRDLGIFQNLSNEKIISGIAAARWPGRMEEIQKDVFIDGAHNPGGIRSLVKTVKEFIAIGKYEGISLLFAVVSDKDYENMIELICRQLPLKYVAVTHINNKRGENERTTADVFEKHLKKDIVETFSDIGEAYTEVLKHKGQGDMVVCAGSLYLIGELKRREEEQCLTTKKN